MLVFVVLNCCMATKTKGNSYFAKWGQFFYCPIYMAAELAGGFFAAIFFGIVRQEEKGNRSAYMNHGKLNAVLAKFEQLFDPEDTAEILGSFFLTLVSSWSPICYFIAEIFGGVLAVAVFRLLTHSDEYKVGGDSFRAPLVGNQQRA